MNSNIQRGEDRALEGVWDSKAEIAALVGIDTTRPRESFEEYLELREGTYPEIAYYLEHGSWRDTTALTDTERETVEDQSPYHQPNNCYYNAQNAMSPQLQYVEGYVIGRASRVPHAWVEINDKVVELTPNIDRDHAEYYGVAFDHVDVAESMIRTEKAVPIVEMKT